MSGRTRSKTIQFSDTPTMHFSLKLEEPPPSSPVEIDEAFSDNSEFLSMMNKTAMLSILGPRGMVDAGRRKDRRPWMTAVGAHTMGAASSCPPLWRTAEKIYRLENPGGYLGLRRRR